MKEQTLVSCFAASWLIHLAVIPLASALIAKPTHPPSYDTIAIDLVDVPRAQEKKVEVAQPQPTRPKPEKITPPKLVQKPEPVEVEPAQRMTQSDLPKMEELKPIPFWLPQTPPGPKKGSGVSANPSGEAEGGEAGAGNLFAKGDVAVVPGKGVGGGGGGQGVAGLGRGARGGGSGEGGIGNGFGPGSGLARPLGGYQVKPRYPDSARRAGVQGVTLLKVRVLENGNVGETFVEQSAGHPDLDRSAADAVKKWRFEPARRGNETIAVWVLLPVRFQLQ